MSAEPPPTPPNDVVAAFFVKIVDLNQDGFGDIVTSNQATDNISVMINSLFVSGGPAGG